MGIPKTELEVLSAAVRDRFVQEFCGSLTPEEAKLFEAANIAKVVLDEVKEAEAAHKEKSKFRKVTEAIVPFIDGLQQYGQALDVLSNASDLLCPIWGGIRIILHVRTVYVALYFVVVSITNLTVLSLVKSLGNTSRS